MTNLILHPTDISQWHALVNEAEITSHQVLNENTESYLVFLLMRFSQKTQLVEAVIGLDFIESMQALKSRQVELLRAVGDKSLLFSGLFPGMASKRHVKLDYYTQMGQSAYLTLSELEATESAHLYTELSHQFTNMQQVLQAMRGQR